MPASGRLKLLDDNVHMGRHDAPSRKRVTIAVSVQQTILNDRGIVSRGKQAAASATVQLAIRPFCAPCWISDMAPRDTRHRIVKSKHNVLNETALVAMRKVAS